VVTPSPEALSAAIAAFLAVALGTISIALLWQWVRDQRRGAVVRRQLATVQNAAAAAGSLLRGKRRESLEPLVALARRFGWAATIEEMLVQAGMTWDVGTFMVLALGCALALLMFTLLLFGSPVISAAAALVGGIIFLINRDYMTVLFEQPLGHWLLGIAVALQLMGFFWIRRIVDIEI
jgi:Flp pilus assembly protein TadB